MNYEELVKALRCFKPLGECIESKCKYLWNGCSCNELQLQRDAAAAIEGLQAEVQKRGEIVRCRECRWGHLCVMGQHLGLDGFCSKGEREVQE